MCEYEYKCQYFIITWVRVRVLVDEYEYEYEYEYWPMIDILYKQQYCIFQSLKREYSDFYKPGTKLQLPTVHVNSICQHTHTHIYIYMFNYSLQFGTMTLQFTYCDVLAVVADNYNLLPVQKQKAKIARYHEICGK